MLDTFTEAYLTCALWSTNDESTPQGGNPLDDNYCVQDIAPETIAAMAADCRAFQVEHGTDISADLDAPAMISG